MSRSEYRARHPEARAGFDRAMISRTRPEADSGYMQVIRAQTPYTRFWRRTIAQLRDRIIGAGLLIDGEMDGFLAPHDDESFVAMSNVTMVVWGRKPC